MKKNVKNLPEFKALIERYDTITLQEIEDVLTDVAWPEDAKQQLTGFGKHSTCTLCIAAGRTGDWGETCKGCVYHGDMGCLRHKTYDMICKAETPEELLKAYRARAKYMRTLITE